MFSPDTIPSTQHASRNPRRRQRSGDSVFPQNVKRQRRSKLSSDTFLPPEQKLNGYANGHANGSAHGDAGVDISRLAIRHGSVGRGEPGSGRRRERGIELVCKIHSSESKRADHAKDQERILCGEPSTKHARPIRSSSNIRYEAKCMFSILA